MFKKQWFFIILSIFFSFFFNILYYKLIQNWLHIYKIYSLLNVSFFFKLKNGFYIFIIILLNILFFIKYYFKFFYNILLLFFIILNNNFILYHLTFFIKYNYIFKSQISLYYFSKYKKLIIHYKKNKNKILFNKLFLEIYLKNYIHYNIFYIFLFIYNILLIDLILYIETYIVQLLHKSKSKKRVYVLNLNYYINRLKFWKKKYYIKMTISFFFQRSKRLAIDYYYYFINKIKYVFRYIKYIISCVIDPIIFQLLKNKGNLFIYYFFYILKFFKSYIKYIWESDIIYKFLKLIERKKWYIEEMHNRNISNKK